MNINTNLMLKGFIFVAVVAMVFLLVLRMPFAQNIVYQREFVDINRIMGNVSKSGSSSNDGVLYFKRQRDMLSKHLNQLKKEYGQQSCEKMKLLKQINKNTEARISENGGWCEETSSASSASHMHDKSFSTALSKFLKGKKVASFGDGPGDYKKHIDSLGEVYSYTAFDGAPFCEKVTNGRVNFLDLTAPQYGMPAFDWVVSVEVGEHIPAKYESVFVDNIVRHAKEGVILSWAVPGQDGLSHVNNKAFADVIKMMKSRGFQVDIPGGKPLRDACSLNWLKKNVHVYRRIDLKSFVEADT